MTTTVNDGGPAFPVVAENGLGHIALRDWFAGQALAGRIVEGGVIPDIAAECYRIADAMLAARTPATER